MAWRLARELSVSLDHLAGTWDKAEESAPAAAGRRRGVAARARPRPRCPLAPAAKRAGAPRGQPRLTRVARRAGASRPAGVPPAARWRRLTQPVFPARRQELRQQWGGRGQGWRLRHPERSGGLGLDRTSPPRCYTVILPGRAGVFSLLGAPGGSGALAPPAAQRPRFGLEASTATARGGSNTLFCRTTDSSYCSSPMRALTPRPR